MDKNIELIAIASALLVGGYFIYKYLKSKPLIPSEPETPFGSLPTNSSAQSNTNNASSESSTTQPSSTNNTTTQSSATQPSSTNNTIREVPSTNTSYQTYGNTNLVNNPAYQTYVKAVESGEVQDTYQNYMASVPEGNTPPAQYLNNYASTTRVSTDISNLPGWIQAELKSGQIASYTDVNTGITYV